MSKICIIIPLYNEEKRFLKEPFYTFYNKNSDVDFCFINDGSIDNTNLLLQELSEGREERVLAINNEQNLGKANAIHYAMNEVLKWNNYEYIGYFDADFATPLTEINLFREQIAKRPDIDIFVGSRIKRLGSQIDRKYYRFFFGRIIATIISTYILNTEIYDTQCGAKLFKQKIISDLFKKPFKSKWFFDVEIFIRAIKLYGHDYPTNKIIEIPLNKWTDIPGSKLTLLDFATVPIQLLKLYLIKKND